MDYHLHHQQPPQNHHHQQEQKQQQQKQYQRRKRSPLTKKEEDVSVSVKMEKRFKNEDDHQDPLVTNLENVFFSDHNQDQQFDSLTQQQVHESSLMEVIKVLQDQINTVSNITDNQDNQFSSSSSSEASPEARFVSEPLISYDNQESCPVKYSDSASTVMASTDLGGIEFSHVLRYRHDEDLFYQLFQYSKILSLNFAYFNNEDVHVDNDQKIGHINNQVSDNQISVSDYLVDLPVDVCVDNNAGGGCVGGEIDDEWIERVLNEVALASESHQVVTEVQ